MRPGLDQEAVVGGGQSRGAQTQEEGEEGEEEEEGGKVPRQLIMSTSLLFEKL